MSSTTQRVDGIVLLDKPAGLTSNQALQRVKRLLRARKGGHTGALDPSATGMLPLCFGEATKICSFLLDADKTYRVVARLGTTTDTADGDGSPVAEAAVPELSLQQWRKILEAFLGESMQVPPMYSAIKKDGKRLYELARRGESVSREPRPIRIGSIELLEAAGSRLVFRVQCSKGTYIRALVEDIATAAGTRAHTEHLHREVVEPFQNADMLSLDALEALAASGADNLRSCLLAPDSALTALPACSVDTPGAAGFRTGRAVECDLRGRSGLARVYGDAGDFLGVAELRSDGRAFPRRVFHGPQEIP